MTEQRAGWPTPQYRGMLYLSIISKKPCCSQYLGSESCSHSPYIWSNSPSEPSQTKPACKQRQASIWGECATAFGYWEGIWHSRTPRARWCSSRPCSGVVRGLERKAGSQPYPIDRPIDRAWSKRQTLFVMRVRLDNVFARFFFARVSPRLQLSEIPLHIVLLCLNSKRTTKGTHLSWESQIGGKGALIATAEWCADRSAGIICNV